MDESTAVGRWAREVEAAENARLPGPGPTLLALLPLVIIAVALRVATPAPAPVVQSAPQLLLEVLVTESGYRLRVTDVLAEGWPEPQRADGAAPLLEARQTYVYRPDGLDPAPALLAAARDLLPPRARPRVWLRGEDDVPWDRLLEAGDALAPIRASDGTAPTGLLAKVSVDARP